MLYNREHPDYLLAKDDDTTLLDYLSTLVAKELSSTTTRAPPAPSSGRRWFMLVRVRRYLPRRAKLS